MLLMKPISLKTISITLAALACLSLATGCSKDRPVLFVTGSDYLHLTKNVPFVPTRDMVLATESVVQDKDQQILDLQKANAELLRQLEYLRSHG